MEIINGYTIAILGLGFCSVLAFCQLLVADFAGIAAKHTPGSPVAGGHESFHFRACRAHANLNESISIFILLSLFAILSGGDVEQTGYAVWSYLGFRLLHALFYYFNVQLMRSVAFGLSLIPLAWLFVIGLRSL